MRLDLRAPIGKRPRMTASAFAEAITVAMLEDDPYPIYRRLRDEAPVCFVPAVGLWLVTRWDDVRHVATHPETFTADVDSSPLTRTLGQNVLTLDGAGQRRIRATLDPSMRPRAVDAYAPEVIQPIAERLLDAIAARGEAELMSEYCEPVSVLALGAVMGLGELDADTLRRWFAGLALGGSNFEGDPEKQRAGDEASQAVDEVVAPILDRLERDPDGSVLAHMLHAEPAGGRLSRAEIMANLKLILLGGMQEPGHALGMTLWALLTHPDAMARVLADRRLAPRAVEEALRWHSPVGTQTRQAVAPTSLGGVQLEAGAAIAAVLASANRDPRHWTDPDRFDLDRDEGAHAAFGLGPHHCAGAPLARQEVRLPLALALERLPGLRLDPDRPPPTLAGWEFRAPEALHVRWRA
jgi:cytochrome P450